MGNYVSNNISNNNEYICNKIISKTKMINNDLTLYNNNLEYIKIIKINKKYKFVINENIYINNDINNDIIINLTIILNEYVSNNFLIFNEETPLINVESIEEYIIKQCK
jgi:hypothetical protein